MTPEVQEAIKELKSDIKVLLDIENLTSVRPDCSLIERYLKRNSKVVDWTIASLNADDWTKFEMVIQIVGTVEFIYLTVIQTLCPAKVS